MPKIITTRNTVVGGQHVSAGKTIEVSKKDATYLCAIGKAKPVEPKGRPGEEGSKDRSVGLEGESSTGVKTR